MGFAAKPYSRLTTFGAQSHDALTVGTSEATPRQVESVHWNCAQLRGMAIKKKFLVQATRL